MHLSASKREESGSIRIRGGEERRAKITAHERDLNRLEHGGPVRILEIEHLAVVIRILF